MKKIMINSIGWLGVLGVLSAYIFLSLGIINGHDFIYQILNGLGAVLLIIESAWHKDYPFTFLNIVWATVAIISLLLMLK